VPKNLSSYFGCLPNDYSEKSSRFISVLARKFWATTLNIATIISFNFAFNRRCLKWTSLAKHLKNRIKIVTVRSG